MAERKKGIDTARVSQRCLAGFFVAMFFCTIASRIYDSVTVPKVACQRMRQKAVETVAAGTGTVKQEELYFCQVDPGLRVASVAVSPGSQVEEGDVLFCFDLDSMEEKKAAWEVKLKKQKLQWEKERVAGEVYPQVTETELAEWELALAQRELEEGQDEYEKKAMEYEEGQQRLKEDYEKKRVLAGDELWILQDQEEEAAWQQLNSAKNSRNAEVRAAKRKVADLEDELGEMEEEGRGEKELAKKRRELERAREDLEDTEERWEDQVDGAESRMDQIGNQNRRILSGETSSQQALREAYEEEAKRRESEWQEEGKKLKSLQKAVRRAQWELEQAAKRDQYAKLGEEQKRKLSLLAQKELELDIRETEKGLEKISLLIARQGQVAAGRGGTVVDQEVEAGKASTGEERLSIALGDFCFEGKFEKEGQKIAVGDVLAVTVPGSNQKREAVIREISLLGEEGVFWAEFSGSGLPLGTVAGYECRRQSETYRQVIPIEGLRKDVKGYYCLVARPRKAILGEELRAERVDVRVVCQGDTEVAVEGGLQDSDPIITGSNQVIGEGARVRQVEG